MMVAAVCLVCSGNCGASSVSINSVLPSSTNTIRTSLNNVVGQQHTEKAIHTSQVLCVKCLRLLFNIVYLERRIVVLREEFCTTFHKGAEIHRKSYQEGPLKSADEGSAAFEEGDCSDAPRYKDDTFITSDLLLPDGLEPEKRFPEKNTLFQEEKITKKSEEENLPIKFEFLHSDEFSVDPQTSSETLTGDPLSLPSDQDIPINNIPKNYLEDVSDLPPNIANNTDTVIYIGNIAERTGAVNDSSLTKPNSFTSEFQSTKNKSDKKIVENGMENGERSEGKREKEDTGTRIVKGSEVKKSENGKVGTSSEIERIGDEDGRVDVEGGRDVKVEEEESIFVIDVDELSSEEEVPVLQFSPAVDENISNSQLTKTIKPGGVRQKKKTGRRRVKKKILNKGQQTLKSEQQGLGEECTLCGEVFSDSKQLGCHRGQVHSSQYPYSCPNCPHAHYREKAKLTQHLRIAHSLTAHPCPGCSHKAASQNSLDQHIIQQHPSSRYYECHICHKSFRTYRYLHFVHIKRCHMGLPIKYSCDKCGRGFVDKSSFENHKLTHKVHRDYTCEFCGAAFRTPYSLKVHVNTHTHEKIYNCCECSATFLRDCNLRAHRHQFHNRGDVQLVCEICGEASATRRDLRRHQQSTHTREKPFACHMCTKTYTTKDSLKTHFRTHTGEKPYKCACGKAFLKRNTLKRHQQSVHDGELPSNSTAPYDLHEASPLQTATPLQSTTLIQSSSIQTSLPLYTASSLETTTPLQNDITVSTEGTSTCDGPLELNQEGVTGGQMVVITLSECDARQSDPLTVYSVDTLDDLSATHVLLTSLPTSTITTSCLSDSVCSLSTTSPTYNSDFANTSLSNSIITFTTTTSPILSHSSTPTLTHSNFTTTSTLTDSVITTVSTPAHPQSNFTPQTTLTNLSVPTPSTTPHLVHLQDMNTSPATVSFVTPWPNTL